MHKTGGQFQKQLHDFCMSRRLKMNSAASIINNCSKPRMTHTSVCWKAVLVVLQWAGDPQHLDKLRINGHLWCSCSVQSLMCQNNWGNKLNSKHQSTFNIKIHIFSWCSCLCYDTLQWVILITTQGTAVIWYLDTLVWGDNFPIYMNQNLYFRFLLTWFTM